MPVNAEFFSYRESDIDAAQVAVEESYFVARMDLLDPAADYEFCFDGVAVGSLRMGRVWYNAAIEASFGDLQNCYFVNVPAAGAMRATHRGQTLDVAAGHGAVYHPNGSVHVRTSHDFDAYAIRIDRNTLRTALETLLEHPVQDAPDLDLDLDLTRGAGASWSMLVAALTLGSARRDTLFSQPLMAAPLHDALITGLLHVAGPTVRPRRTHHQRRPGHHRQPDRAPLGFPAPVTVRPDLSEPLRPAPIHNAAPTRTSIGHLSNAGLRLIGAPGQQALGAANVSGGEQIDLGDRAEHDDHARRVHAQQQAHSLGTHSARAVDTDQHEIHRSRRDDVQQLETICHPSNLNKSRQRSQHVGHPTKHRWSVVTHHHRSDRAASCDHPD